MMRIIKLYGELKDRFGESFKFDVRSASQAFGAMIRQVKGFGDAIMPNRYYIMLGNPKDNIFIGAEELNYDLHKNKEIHVIPVVSGGGGNLGKIILGTVLFTAGLALVAINPALGASVALAGAGLFLQGVAGVLTPVPKVNTDAYENREDANNRPSFLFSGPVNTSQQGLPIPLVYGRMRVGSQIISSGISTEAVT